MIRQRIEISGERTVRVDRLLAETLVGFSRRRLQRLLEEGRIRVDGHRARKGEMFRGPRVIEVTVEEPAIPELPPETEPAVPILFADESCVAVDKPARRPGHALRSGERGTVANFLAARFPECLAAGKTPLEAGLVHRLDTQTSGVLLAARSPLAWQRLRRQFSAGTITKAYIAAVRGVIASGGETRAAIGPDPRNRRKVRVLAPGEGSRPVRPAITRYRPLSHGADSTLLAVEIPTGVMHQIRAHLAAIGHPVLGDTLYGSEPIPEGRHLLHARLLAFDHPQDGRRIEVESPLPEDYRAALARLTFGPALTW